MLELRSRQQANFQKPHTQVNFHFDLVKSSWTILPSLFVPHIETSLQAGELSSGQCNLSSVGHGIGHGMENTFSELKVNISHELKGNTRSHSSNLCSPLTGQLLNAWSWPVSGGECRNQLGHNFTASRCSQPLLHRGDAREERGGDGGGRGQPTRRARHPDRVHGWQISRPRWNSRRRLGVWQSWQVSQPRATWKMKIKMKMFSRCGSAYLAMEALPPPPGTLVQIRPFPHRQAQTVVC